MSNVMLNKVAIECSNFYGWGLGIKISIFVEDENQIIN